MIKKLILFLLISATLPLFSQTRTDSIHVAHYKIQLKITNLGQHQISGNTILSVVPKVSGVTSICIDLQGLSVDSVFMNNSFTSFVYNSPRIDIPTSVLTPNDTQYVTIFYHGTPVADPYWGGFYFSGSYAYNMGVGMQSIPPSFGRCWFPCIDDFNDKATYEVYVETDSDKMAVCGGLLTDNETLPSGNKLWKWSLTDPIPTYLASVAVGPYQLYSDTVLSSNQIIPVEIYGNSNQMPLIPGSFQNLKQIVHGFIEHFGTYRWQKVGYVLVPFNGGAMEHATNIGYPGGSVNGTTADQSLFIHELAHSWFGNLLTCTEPSTMWINEGFARYAEIVADEFLDTTGVTAKVNFRNLHRSVLKNAHIDDGDYFALDNIPQSVTYGTTTYDKGGIVVHSLRSYMGDSLFFNGFKTLFNQNLFGNINSIQLINQLSQITNIDLNGFYNGWIHQPGFLHFSIDSIIPMNQPDGYILSMKQKLYHANNFADDNKVDVAFYSNSGDYKLIENIIFSGESAYVQVSIPFQPDFWIIDPNERLADAIIDYTVLVPPVGLVNSNDAFFKIKSIVSTDTTKVKVEYNLAQPDPLRSTNPNVYRISTHHYWKIEFLENHITSGEFQFRYSSNGTNSPDAILLDGYTKDDLIILYRRNATQDWKIIPSTVTGNSYTGYLIINQILPGEYVLAVGNDQLGIHESIDKKTFEIYPNPATNILFYTIYQTISEDTFLEIYDQNSKLIFETPIQTHLGQRDISSLSPGVYVVVFKHNNQKIGSSKLTIMN